VFDAFLFLQNSKVRIKMRIMAFVFAAVGR